MRMIAVVVVCCALTACSPPVENIPAGASAEAAPATTPVGPISSQGVVTAIDVGSVTLEHEPIAAIGWSAMTMRFSIEPALLDGVAVGDTVVFELESAQNPRTITKMSKQ